jgi:hypothetical protein
MPARFGRSSYCVPIVCLFEMQDALETAYDVLLWHISLQEHEKDYHQSMGEKYSVTMKRKVTYT